MFTFFMLAIMLTTVANVLVTMSLAPLLTALAARLLLVIRIPVRTWLAIVVAGLGIAYMYGSQLGQGVSLAGTLLALCVPISGAANWTINQHSHAQGHDVDLMPAILIGACCPR
jgi:drug/metabolite transporter (DMT)-like permease